MKHFSLRLFIAAFFIISMPYLIKGEDLKDEKETEISWFSFEWLPAPVYSNLENPKGIMRFSPTVDGVSGMQGFRLSIELKENYIYESALENLIWRKPDLENNILSFRSAGRTKTRVLEDVELAFGNEIRDYTDFEVISNNSEPKNSEISGFIGHGFFKSRNKILVIDYPGTRFTELSKLPEKWEEKAHFTEMESSPHFLSLNLRANNSRIRLSFDHEPIPALTLYRKWDFRRIASDVNVTDSLRYFHPQNNSYKMLGGKEPQRDIYFGPYKLKSHNVYLMPERRQRIGSDNGLITQPFFEDYVLILDFKNKRFGIMPPHYIDN